MVAPRRVIKFAPKLVEINRQYELNNNAELDNGVYHFEDQEAVSDRDSSNGGHARTFQSVGNNGGLPTNEKKDLATSFGQKALESQLGELK